MNLEQKLKNVSKNMLIGSSLLLPLYSCAGAQPSDYVKAAASMAGAGGLANTAEQAAALSGISSLAGSVSENNRAKMSAPNINVYGGGNSGNTQPLIVEKEMAVDVNNLRFDSRVSDMVKLGNNLLFCLNFDGQKDIYSAIENDNYEWEKVRKLTYTPDLNELNPRFLADGKHFSYKVEKINNSNSVSVGRNSSYWNKIFISDFDGNSKIYNSPRIIESNLEEKFGILGDSNRIIGRRIIGRMNGSVGGDSNIYASELWMLDGNNSPSKKLCDINMLLTRGHVESISDILFRDSSDEELKMDIAYGGVVGFEREGRHRGNFSGKVDLEFKLYSIDNVFNLDSKGMEKTINLNGVSNIKIREIEDN